MEREDDVQLVHAVLSGDDTAFDILVEKYQKSVHAFVWQKIGDFHYAEEITQDTFLLAYSTIDEKGFATDFTITLGTHRSGADLLDTLTEEKCRVSVWSRQALENPDFPVVAEEITVDIVVVSMRELGFAEDTFATVDTIYDRAKQMGLETCPIETAVQLRLQFLDQPD